MTMAGKTAAEWSPEEFQSCKTTFGKHTSAAKAIAEHNAQWNTDRTTDGFYRRLRCDGIRGYTHLLAPGSPRQSAPRPAPQGVLAPEEPPAPAPQNVRRYVLGADIHGMFDMLDPFVRFLAYFRPHGIGLVGDIVDLAALYGCKGRSPARIEWDAARLEMNKAGIFLDAVDRACKPDQKDFWLGNHERRIEAAEEAHPDYIKNNLSVIPNTVKDLRLVERGYRVHAQHDVVEYGKLGVTHGNYYNDLHCKKMLAEYGRDIAYFHVHDAQRYTKHTPVTQEPISAWSIGCLCDRKPKYQHGVPNRWARQFAVLYVRPDGEFNLYPVDIRNGSFVAPDGRLYG